MKKSLYSALSVVMAIVILVASTGYGLIEHSCMMRGKSVQLVTSKAKKACKGCPAAKRETGSRQDPVVKKTDCCKDDLKFEKVDLVTSTAQVLAKLLKAFSAAFISSFFPELSSVHDGLGALVATSSPPPISFSSLLHGRSMLSFVQKLLI